MALDNIEDFSAPEASNKPAENAEREKKSAQAKARAQKFAKDEGRSKRYDISLSEIILLFLQDPSKEGVLGAVIDALEAGVPSGLLLGAVSLIDEETSLAIQKQAEKIIRAIEIERTPEEREFNEQKIDPQLQIRMNIWFDSILTSLFTNSSVVAAHKFYQVVSLRLKKDVTDFAISTSGFLEEEKVFFPEQYEAYDRSAALLSETFLWFLRSLNYRVSPTKAKHYAKFILDEVIRRTKLFLETSDIEVMITKNIDLFGI